MTEGNLGGKTLFISGGSRGIGLAIAVRAARDGANVAFLAKTDVLDPAAGELELDLFVDPEPALGG